MSTQPTPRSTSRRTETGALRSLRGATDGLAHDSRRDPGIVSVVLAAARGDERAWQALHELFDGTLRAVARSYRLQPTDVDEAVQATWIRLFRHIGRIEQPSAIRAWLVTTARRESMRILQRPMREQPSDDPRLGELPEDPVAETDLLRSERKATLQSAVAALPERSRLLIAALISEPSLSYAEVARVLDIPIGSIGPTRARALRQLRQHLGLRALRDDLEDSA